MCRDVFVWLFLKAAPLKRSFAVHRFFFLLQNNFLNIFLEEKKKKTGVPLAVVRSLLLTVTMVTAADVAKHLDVLYLIWFFLSRLK